MTREEQIKDYMKKLGIDREEAIQLIEDDSNDFIGSEGEKMTANAKKIIRYEQSDNKRKPSTKERKVDTTKLDILQTLAAALEAEYDITVDIEREVNLHFDLDGENFSIKLTRHKKKK